MERDVYEPVVPHYCLIDSVHAPAEPAGAAPLPEGAPPGSLAYRPPKGLGGSKSPSKRNVRSKGSKDSKV